MAYYRATIIGQCLGQMMVNTFAFRDRGAAPVEPLPGLFARVDAWITSHYRTLHVPARTFTLLDVRELGSPVPLVYQLPPTSTQGTAAGQPTNPAEAVVLTLKSVYASRRRTGRIYLGGFPTDAVVQGQLGDFWRTTTLPNFAAGTMGLFGPAGTEPYQLGIWSDTQYAATPGQPDQAFTPVAQIRINRITGAQRRRRIGVGA